MKKIIVFITILLLYGCASKPEIIRKMIPETDKDVEINDTAVTKEKDNVIVTIRYMDKIELHEIAKANNPYLEGDTPLLTTFKMTIENQRKNKISFNLQDAVILDGLGHQFQPLTYEDFKNMYPSTIYHQYEYSFVFNRYTKEPHLTDDYHKRTKAAKTLFKGGKIYPGVTVEGVLPFERLSAYAKDITLILSDIKLYNEKEDSDKNSKDETEEVVELQFKFKQKIVRLKD